MRRKLVLYFGIFLFTFTGIIAFLGIDFSEMAFDMLLLMAFVMVFTTTILWEALGGKG